MAKEKISIKFLIHLVGERPAIWDKASRHYRDRELKETSWQEICSFVNENYNQMSQDEKTEFTKMVCKKWTYIRDAWVKSMRFGYDPETKLPPKPYVYHHELKFLQKILQFRRPRYDFIVPETMDYSCSEPSKMNEFDNTIDIMDGLNDTDIKNHNDNGAEEKDEDDWPVIAEVKSKASSSLDIEGEQKKDSTDQEGKPQHTPKEKTVQSAYTSAPQVSRNVNPHPRNYWDNVDFRHNRHWNFFKSVLPSLNNLDDDHTLQFHSGVLSLLQKLKADQYQKLSHMTTSKKKRKKNKCSDDDSDWPLHKVKVFTRRSTRSKSKPLTDPIANDEDETSSENESVEYV